MSCMYVGSSEIGFLGYEFAFCLIGTFFLIIQLSL